MSAPARQSWDTLTLYELVESALKGFSEQIFDQTPFRALPERKRKKILLAIKSEAITQLWDSIPEEMKPRVNDFASHALSLSEENLAIVLNALKVAEAHYAGEDSLCAVRAIRDARQEITLQRKRHDEQNSESAETKS